MQAGPADLAFEDAELTTECNDLDPQRGISLPGEDEEIEQAAWPDGE